ncbi:hypothetical protein G7054_g13768 [Neopestalotiopsis clavispora]|nr:hypothetical protein G7054_g13768 [Neopestalotiopsis clavispora]
MVWWDTKLVEKAVTREFVSSRLHAKNAERLDQVLGFGNGLTDETYWEWIEAKSKRIFLILEDVGIPDQIFGAVDHSWEDDDVPIPLNDVDRVTGTKDQKLNWKFWDRQFYYVMREIEEGRHMNYGDDEIVPVDIVERKQAATALVHSHHIDKVVLSNKPNKVLNRVRIPVSKIGNGVSQEEFLNETRSTSNFQNDHIISYFASYTHLDSVCVLTTASTEYSLKTALTNIPATLKAHLKQDGRIQVMNWIHCLADTICYLHGTGGSHGSIKPSSVGFDLDHKILLTDRSILSLEGIPASTDRTAFNKESYDYAAPEQWFRPTNSNNLYNNITKSAHIPSSGSSASSGSYAISINKGGPGYGGAQHHPVPQLDPQAADIFSIGCIMLELLGFLFSKRTSKSFAAHRGDKHRHAGRGGRGGAPSDASFHKNLGQVESWMVALAKDAGKKKDDAVLRGVAPMLQMVARMLSITPQDRPSAYAVERHMYQVLTEHCGIAEPHCVHQYEQTAAFIDSPVIPGLDGLRIGTTGADDESLFSIAGSSRRVSRQGRSSFSSTRAPTTPTLMTRPLGSQSGLEDGLTVPRGHRGMQKSIAATAQKWGVSYAFEDAAQTST